jgi:hypothetical protein
MDSNAAKVAAFLVFVALFFGVRACNERSASNEAKEAMYERYAALGDPDAVKAAVDKHHPAIFDETYKTGWGRRQKSSFDAEQYARRMDREIERELGDLRQAAAVAAHQQRSEQRAAEQAARAQAREQARQQSAQRGAAAGGGGAGAAAAVSREPHAITVEAATARRASATEVQPTSFNSKQYVLEAVIADEGGDVSAENPPRFALDLQCEDYGLISTPGGTPRKVIAMGARKAVIIVPVIVPVDTAGQKPCHAVLVVTDQAGNRSESFTKQLPYP